MISFFQYQYHKVQITLPGGHRYTCCLHRLLKLLQGNDFQMENLSSTEWANLPDHLKWVPLPDYKSSSVESSHLCGNPKCLNPDHIIFESHKVIIFQLLMIHTADWFLKTYPKANSLITYFQTNLERSMCHKLGVCQGHRDGYNLLRPCINE